MAAACLQTAAMPHPLRPETDRQPSGNALCFFFAASFAASSAAFREALSLPARPLESTDPEAKKARKRPNQEPANTSESRHDKYFRDGREDYTFRPKASSSSAC